MIWLKKLTIIIMLFCGLIIFIATSPQVTKDQSNLTQHTFVFKANQKQVWLHLEVQSNQSIQSQDLFQSELHFDLDTRASTVNAEQQRWQLVFYNPVDQNVFWVEDLQVTQNTSSVIDLSLTTCDRQQVQWQKACLPCHLDDGSCQAHMYLMRNHHPLAEQSINITIQQLYPKSHEVDVTIHSSSQAIVY